MLNLFRERVPVWYLRPIPSTISVAPTKLHMMYFQDARILKENT